PRFGSRSGGRRGPRSVFSVARRLALDGGQQPHQLARLQSQQRAGRAVRLGQRTIRAVRPGPGDDARRQGIAELLKRPATDLNLADRLVTVSLDAFHLRPDRQDLAEPGRDADGVAGEEGDGLALVRVVDLVADRDGEVVARNGDRRGLLWHGL